MQWMSGVHAFVTLAACRPVDAFAHDIDDLAAIAGGIGMHAERPLVGPALEKQAGPDRAGGDGAFTYVLIHDGPCFNRGKTRMFAADAHARCRASRKSPRPTRHRSS